MIHVMATRDKNWAGATHHCNETDQATEEVAGLALILNVLLRTTTKIDDPNFVSEQFIKVCINSGQNIEYSWEEVITVFSTVRQCTVEDQDCMTSMSGVKQSPN